MTITAIETRFAGCLFRSRIEARWAVWFNALGITWEYEKEGYHLSTDDYYLPDFWLPQFDAWFEVKGQPMNEDEQRKARYLASEHKPVITAAGAIGSEIITVFAQDSSDSGGGWYQGEGFWVHAGNLPAIALFEPRMMRDQVICDNEWQPIPWVVCVNDLHPEQMQHPVIRGAYAQASSARFEHGQRG